MPTTHRSFVTVLRPRGFAAVEMAVLFVLIGALASMALVTYARLRRFTPSPTVAHGGIERAVPSAMLRQGTGGDEALSEARLRKLEAMLNEGSVHPGHFYRTEDGRRLFVIGE